MNASDADLSLSPSLRALADALVAARRAGRTIDAVPWRDALQQPGEAYAVQDAVAAALGWFEAGAMPGCWKSGGGSRSATLTHAPLPSAGVRQGPADFSDLVFHQPGIEADVALRLGREVTPDMAATLAAADAAGLVDAMTVSIEICDARWQDRDAATPLLRLADSQVHGALALGEWRPFAALDWASQRCVATVGSAEPVRREGSHPLGDPAWLLPVWLRHLTRHRNPVPAGTVVTTGSWVGMLPCARGDQVTAEFPGIGTVRLRV